MKNIVKKHLDKAMSYTDYRALVDQLLKENKTTGDNQSEDYVHYTKLSAFRMKRLDKTLKLEENDIDWIKNISTSLTFLTITEGWCGDAGHIVPVIEKIAAQNDHIKTAYILRDDNPELMDLFLTNGGRAIPIVIVIDNNSDEVLTHWGPRPEFMQNWVNRRKNDPKATPYLEFVVEAQKWYNDDKGRSIINEFGTALRKALKKTSAV